MNYEHARTREIVTFLAQTDEKCRLLIAHDGKSVDAVNDSLVIGAVIQDFMKEQVRNMVCMRGDLLSLDESQRGGIQIIENVNAPPPPVQAWLFIKGNNAMLIDCKTVKTALVSTAQAMFEVKEKNYYADKKTRRMSHSSTQDANAIHNQDGKEKAVLTQDAKAVPTHESKAVLTQDAKAVLTQDAKAVLTQDAQAVLTQDAKAVPTHESNAVLTQDAKAVLTQDAKDSKGLSLQEDGISLRVVKHYGASESVFICPTAFYQLVDQCDSKVDAKRALQLNAIDVLIAHGSKPRLRVMAVRDCSNSEKQTGTITFSNRYIELFGLPTSVHVRLAQPYPSVGTQPVNASKKKVGSVPLPSANENVITQPNDGKDFDDNRKTIDPLWREKLQAIAKSLAVHVPASAPTPSPAPTNAPTTTSATALAPTTACAPTTASASAPATEPALQTAPSFGSIFLPLLPFLIRLLARAFHRLGDKIKDGRVPTTAPAPTNAPTTTSATPLAPTTAPATASASAPATEPALQTAPSFGSIFLPLLSFLITIVESVDSFHQLEQILVPAIERLGITMENPFISPVARMIFSVLNKYDFTTGKRSFLFIAKILNNVLCDS